MLRCIGAAAVTQIRRLRQALQKQAETALVSELMRAVKRQFDPSNLMNPGKAIRMP